MIHASTESARGNLPSRANEWFYAKQVQISGKRGKKEKKLACGPGVCWSREQRYDLLGSLRLWVPGIFLFY